MLKPNLKQIKNSVRIEMLYFVNYVRVRIYKVLRKLYASMEIKCLKVGYVIHGCHCHSSNSLNVTRFKDMAILCLYNKWVAG